MIPVWDIEVGVCFHTRAGQSLVGFILDNNHFAKTQSRPAQ